MRRLSTIIADLEHAAADLEILAGHVEQSDPNKASRLRSEAGGLAQIVASLHNV